MTPTSVSPRKIELFWRKVDRTTEEECWLWKGALFQKTGYGLFNLKIPTNAHRVSWLINKGPIPEGMYVLHKCDCRQCVNPSHLFIGTQGDNMRDMVRKGRNCRQDGDYNHGRRFTWAEVKAMREQHRQGVRSKDLVRFYKTSSGHISLIINHKIWHENQYEMGQHAQTIT